MYSWSISHILEHKFSLVAKERRVKNQLLILIYEPIVYRTGAIIFRNFYPQIAKEKKRFVHTLAYLQIHYTIFKIAHKGSVTSNDSGLGFFNDHHYYQALVASTVASTATSQAHTADFAQRPSLHHCSGSTTRQNSSSTIAQRPPAALPPTSASTTSAHSSSRHRKYF